MKKYNPRKQQVLLALLALTLPLLVCTGGEELGKIVGPGTGATTGHDLCVRACQDVDLKFYRYRHDGEKPGCWCEKGDGGWVKLW